MLCAGITPRVFVAARPVDAGRGKIINPWPTMGGFFDIICSVPLARVGRSEPLGQDIGRELTELLDGEREDSDMTNVFENSDVVVYAPTGMPRLDVVLSQDSIWMTMQQMGQVFGVDRSVIGKHIRNHYHPIGKIP